MKFLLLTFLAALLMAGCGKSSQMTGPGGGAAAPVTVTLLLDEPPEGLGKPREAVAGDRSTRVVGFEDIKIQAGPPKAAEGEQPATEKSKEE